MAGFDDLSGTLHAAALLMLPVATGGLVFAFHSAPDRERVMRALGISVPILLAYFLLGFYFTKHGWPVTQVVLPLACVWAGIYIGLPAAHKAFSIFMMVAAIGMLLWYAMLIQDRYIGFRKWVSEQQSAMDQHLAVFKEDLTKMGRPDQYSYMPGWLGETDLYKIAYRRELKNVGLMGNVERAHPLWHTWLTALYARLSVRREIYFPGGRVVEGAPKMEWRDRPQ